MAKTPRINSQADIYKISNPSGNTVRLGVGSFATIAGVQYQVTSNLDVTPTLASTTLYMMYAIPTGVPSAPLSLVVSTNVNSVGPSGATAWKLVGAFYSNGNNSVAFGSFVNITGAPHTQGNIPYAGSVLNLGVGTVSGQSFTFRREGSRMVFENNFLMGTGGSAGNTVQITVPGSFPLLSPTSGGGTTTTGFASTYTVVPTTAGFDIIGTNIVGSGSLGMLKRSTGSFIVGSDMTASAQLHLISSFEISGLTNTQLLDL